MCEKIERRRKRVLARKTQRRRGRRGLVIDYEPFTISNQNLPDEKRVTSVDPNVNVCLLSFTCTDADFRRDLRCKYINYE